MENRLNRSPQDTGGAAASRYLLDSLACVTEHLSGAVCLSVSGELDLAAVPTFLGNLGRASEAATNVIVDVRGLRYIDSAGINSLLDAHRRFRRAGRHIVLAAPSQMMIRILSIVSLEEAVPIFPTVEDALRSFAGKARRRA